MQPSDQWWTINGAILMESLRRARKGEDPDLIYLELDANSSHERPNEE